MPMHPDVSRRVLGGRGSLLLQLQPSDFGLEGFDIPFIAGERLALSVGARGDPGFHQGEAGHGGLRKWWAGRLRPMRLGGYPARVSGVIPQV